MKQSSAIGLFAKILCLQIFVLLVCYFLVSAIKNARDVRSQPPEKDRRIRGVYVEPAGPESPWRGFDEEFLAGVHQWDYVKTRVDQVQNPDDRYFLLNQLTRSSAPDGIKAQCFYELSLMDSNEDANKWAWINGYLATSLSNNDKYRAWFRENLNDRIKSASGNYRAFRNTLFDYELAAEGQLANVRSIIFKTGTEPKTFLQFHQAFFRPKP